MTGIHDDCGHERWQEDCAACERQRQVNRDRAAAWLEHRPFSWPDRPGFFEEPATPARADDG